MSYSGKCPNCEIPYQGDPVTCPECGEVLSTLPIMRVATELASPPLSPEQIKRRDEALADVRKAYAEAKNLANKDRSVENG